ncbi:MAG: TFIIB-type zinc ribbon-containing protein [Bradymonadia bacterium]
MASADSIHDFSDEILVRCPRCKARAVVRDGRLTCSACGLTRTFEGITYNEHPYGSEVELWLKTPCCGHTLWAYNTRHLTFIEAFIGAENRRRQLGRHEEGCSNTALESRLPQWMKDRRNRENVMRGLRQLWRRMQ